LSAGFLCAFADQNFMAGIFASFFFWRREVDTHGLTPVVQNGEEFDDFWQISRSVFDSGKVEMREF